MAKKNYVTKIPINHNGEDIKVGSALELDDKIEAPQLLEVGAIELDTAKKAAAK